MKPAFNVREVYSNVSQLGAAMRELTSQDVYIGVPEEKAERNEEDGNGITSAYLSYIHEHGVPEQNIPEAPHLMPGIADIKPEAIKILESCAKAALEGKKGAVTRGLNRIGLLGQNAVRARFVNNNWAPLAARTLARKIGNKTRLERGRVNRLLLTGQLQKAHTYVIRRRGAMVITED